MQTRDKVFHQNLGLHFGTALAPDLANLSIGFQEGKLKNQMDFHSSQASCPLLFETHTDDIQIIFNQYMKDMEVYLPSSIAWSRQLTLN